MTETATRAVVRKRAKNRCEYCAIQESDFPFAPFHVEHIVPRKHGGSDDLQNLALACLHCNLHKGPNLTGIDPVSGQIERLFNPRVDSWTEHFAFRGVTISGLTPAGRATAAVLNMNAAGRLELRAVIADANSTRRP